MTSVNEFETEIDSATGRYVAVLDILGFRNLLKQHGTNDLARIYLKAISESQELLNRTREESDFYVPPEYCEDEGLPGSASMFVQERRVKVHLLPGIEKVALFSDSIFLFGANDKEATLRSVLCASVALFRIFLRHGLPLSGAIAGGDAIVSPSTEIYLGTAIVDAYVLANTIDAVGIVIHGKVPDLDSLMSEAMEVRLKPDKPRESLCHALRVPILSNEEFPHLNITEDWKRAVHQQQVLARKAEKEDRWRNSFKILTALLNTEIGE